MSGLDFFYKKNAFENWSRLGKKVKSFLKLNFNIIFKQ